jgi:protein-S-isoprenylcysteine O-methyltransferase Ste14
VIILLWLAWCCYLLAFLTNHLRVRLERQGRTAERRGKRSRLSDWGMALQGLGLLGVFLLRRSWDEPDWLALTGISLAWIGVGLTWTALAYLRRHWRMTAVVTEDHELVADGPYRKVRHPVYTALFLMLIGTIFLISNWTAAVAAVAVFSLGTELRIAAEEKVLSDHFPDAYTLYRRRTSAWLPPFR